MSDIDQDLEKQIKEMALLTVLSNKINPIQEQNLKMYPMVFFQGVKSVKIDFDLQHRKTTMDEPVINSNIVSYYITIDENAQNEHLAERFKYLEQSVKNLFWNDLTVEVYFNDIIKFKSKSAKNG